MKIQRFRRVETLYKVRYRQPFSVAESKVTIDSRR